MYLEELPKEHKILIQMTAKDLRYVIEKTAEEAVNLEKRLIRMEKKNKESNNI